MLTSLQVRNFAIIDAVEVEFGAGMTVLTGETGAGKSILVDALALVLGERGSATVVRDGAERAEIAADFDLAAHAGARAWLAEQALDADDDCVLRRVIGADGRSRAFINGSATTLASLKELGELLIDIHGQHFHQSLGRRAVQRDLLDHYAGLSEARAQTAQAFANWQDVAARLAALEAAESERASRLDLLAFQLQELEALALADGELDELRAERERLQNSGRIADGIASALALAYEAEDGNAHQLLARARQALEPIAGYEPAVAEAAALLADAEIKAAEAADTLQRAVDGLDADPERRDWVEERLDAIRSLARKHRVEATELGAHRERLQAELDELEHASERGAALAAEARKAEQQYRELAAALTAGRGKAAKRFGNEVTAAMADLGMPGGVFEVRLVPRADDDPRAWGVEDVEYRISANPGQPAMPLAKIASGGELSRMSLAIQVIASGGSAIPTMIFDEVDSGVGGGVAEMVGRRLRELAADRQVLCVTHLPQVASQAQQHLRVSKITDGRSTRTTLAALTEDERVEELARMLGGVEITRATRDHAAEMLGRAGKSPRKRKARR